MRKLNIVCFSVIAMCVSVLFASDMPEKEGQLDKLICSFQVDYHGIAKDQRYIIRFAETNQIPKEVFYGMLEKHIEAALEGLQSNPEEGRRRMAGVRLAKTLWVVAETHDEYWIPEIKRIYDSPIDKNTRGTVILAFIDLSPVASLEFVEKAIENQEINAERNRLVWKKMGEQYPRANERDKKRISAFLLRQMEKTTYVNDIEDIDKALATHVPGYRTSLQRKKYVEKFLKSGNDYTANLGRKIAEEIEKVPVEQRKDLSELLQKPADETKGE